MFAVPFEEIAAIVGPHARRRPAAGQPGPAAGPGRDAGPDADRARQREVVDAFLAAARGGDFDGLLALLDPDVVLRVDTGGAGRRSPEARPRSPARRRCTGQPGSGRGSRVVNGGPGVVSTIDGRLSAVLAFTVADGLIVEIDILADPQRLAALDIVP